MRVVIQFTCFLGVGYAAAYGDGFDPYGDPYQEVGYENPTGNYTEGLTGDSPSWFPEAPPSYGSAGPIGGISGDDEFDESMPIPQFY